VRFTSLINVRCIYLSILHRSLGIYRANRARLFLSIGKQLLPASRCVYFFSRAGKVTAVLASKGFLSGS